MFFFNDASLGHIICHIILLHTLEIVWLLQLALQVFKLKCYVLTTCTINADENRTAQTAVISLQEYKIAYC